MKPEDATSSEDRLERIESRLEELGRKDNDPSIAIIAAGFLIGGALMVGQCQRQSTPRMNVGLSNANSVPFKVQLVDKQWNAISFDGTKE
ncbi:MAG: hypothetical protein CBC35_01575 [Planctomycetes bacterium TMED75]|nr:hypothetical protein [Planctomycetaceae bacterium]OUU96249.1 MAG: hypothetical protein CBC35_01575 [Planctomycetes bacterium TMED75]